MKVAIVHDWLVGGGAEKVVEQLHKIYPDAPIYTSYCTDEWRRRLDNKVITGWLQHLGFARKMIPILRIWWFTRLDFSDFDLVISSSGNGEALGVKTNKNTLHVNYCHSPTHFYWRFYEEYLNNPGHGKLNMLSKIGLRLLVRPLRAWDYKAAQRPDFFISNSSHIQAEIKHFYGRDSVVIHPPVDIERFNSTTTKDHTRYGFVTASRQVPQKRFDVIIGAANELKLPLTVIGRGPEHEKLEKMAGETVTLLDNVSDEELPILFAKAEAFLFAAYEDFGVTPVEALASGTPVIAYKKGGALDYIKPGLNGEFFEVQSVASLCACLNKFRPKGYGHNAVRETAKSFSSANFREEFKRYVDNLLKLKDRERA